MTNQAKGTTRVWVDMDNSIVVVLNKLKHKYETSRTEIIERAVLEFIARQNAAKVEPTQPELFTK